MAKDKSVIATRTQMIAGDLTDEIAKGHYTVGARFPTEAELRLRFGVGRHTIREALKLLTEQGLIGRRRKTGTFVLSTSPVSPYVHSLRDLKGLLDFAHALVHRLGQFVCALVFGGEPVVLGMEGIHRRLSFGADFGGSACEFA